nr:recombinase family protein [Pseudonocardia sp. ICBG601]
MELGYARVSTTHQDLERQLDALGHHGIPDERIYTDKKTGATIDRPGFTELRRYARSGDTIIATTSTDSAAICANASTSCTSCASRASGSRP